MRKRQSLNALVNIREGKRFHHRAFSLILMRLLFRFLLFHSGTQFSAKDQENDLSSFSCAERYKGAWWYKSCHRSNLNGQYLGGPHNTFADGINWKAFRGQHYSLKRSEMKLRPQQ